MLCRCPPADDFNPLRQATAMLAFDVDYIRVALTATAYSILLDCIPGLPIIIFLFSLLFVCYCRLQEGWPC